MDDRRKKLGKRVRRDRELAGYRSQRAFAAELALHERSVAAVERGEKAGETVLGLIEGALSWPEGGIAKFLETGDETYLQSSKSKTADRGHVEVERIVAMTRRELLEEADSYDRTLGDGAGEEWLHWAMDVRKRATSKPSATREKSVRDAETPNSRG